MPEVEGQSQGNWFDKYNPPAEDHGILGKYKDEGEAIASIGARERHISQTIRVPDAKAKPEDRSRSIREIMGRLGAFDEPAKYEESLRSLIPANLKDEFSDEDIATVAKEAHRRGVLPEAFAAAMKERIEETGKKSKESKEKETSENQRKVDDDKFITDLWGRSKTDKLKDGEAFAKHLDSVFATMNRQRFSEEEIANGGGVFQRMLGSTTAPEMKILFAEMQRRIFGGTTPPGGGSTPGGNNMWQKHYDSFMRDCGGLADAAERARKYADSMVGGPR